MNITFSYFLPNDSFQFKNYFWKHADIDFTNHNYLNTDIYNF